MTGETGGDANEAHLSSRLAVKTEDHVMEDPPPIGEPNVKEEEPATPVAGVTNEQYKAMAAITNAVLAYRDPEE